jgi:fused signal recognition particle receptor
MLGWFKKKFGKQADEPQQDQAELSEAAVPSVDGIQEPGADSAPLPGESVPAVAADLSESAVPVAPIVPATEAQYPDVEQVEAVQESAVAEIEVVAVGFGADEAGKPPITEGSASLSEPEGEVKADTVAMEPAPLVEEKTETSLQKETGAEGLPEPLASGEHRVSSAPPASSDSAERPAAKSMFQRLQERLGKTRDAFVNRLDRLFLGKKEIDQDLFDQLEEILITADLGVATTMELLDEARNKVKRDQLSDPQVLKTILRDQLLAYIEAADRPAELVMPNEGPFVIMVVGVNGVGKTTTIGKMAAKFTRAGQSVLLVAGDTFRAAAINQLRIWGERVGVEVFARQPGDDPSSVAFDSLEYGVAHEYDVIIMDTAGRLHTSVNLMEELKKIKRVIGKKLPGAPHEVMLVLDATTGQNGISQARLFHEAVGVSGLTLTKLDGTAKGGIVANVCRETKIPVRFIGIGEQLDDLRDFDAREFVDALFARQVQ